MRSFTNLPRSFTNLLGSFTNLLRSFTKLLRSSTNPLRSFTNLLRSFTNLLRSSTNPLRSSINLLRSFTNLLRSFTNLLRSSTNLPRSSTNLLRYSTNLLRSFTNLLWSSTNLLRSFTNLLRSLQTLWGLLQTFWGLLQTLWGLLQPSEVFYKPFKGTVHCFNTMAKTLANGSLMTVLIPNFISVAKMINIELFQQKYCIKIVNCVRVNWKIQKIKYMLTLNWINCIWGLWTRIKKNIYTFEYAKLDFCKKKLLMQKNHFFIRLLCISKEATRWAGFINETQIENFRNSPLSFETHNSLIKKFEFLYTLANVRFCTLKIQKYQQKNRFLFTRSKHNFIWPLVKETQTNSGMSGQLGQGSSIIGNQV